MKDDRWLGTQFPFRLVPTNLDNVYTTEALPEDFDLKNASDSDLVRRGLLLRRPKPEDSAAFKEIWNKICERGVRIATPQLRARPKIVRPAWRRRLMEQAGFNWCGGVEGHPRALFDGGWNSVYGALTLPYLSLPSGIAEASQTAGLSGWVGLGGWNWDGNNQLLQTILSFQLNQTPSGITTFFNLPGFQWWVPVPGNAAEQQQAAGGDVINPPPMNSGDLVFMFAGYVQAQDGSTWGSVFWLFVSDFEPGVTPLPFPIFNFLVPGPGGGPVSPTVEWIMENEAVTNNQPNTTVPVFSASAEAITPVTFIGTGGSDVASVYTPSPANGFAAMWSTLNGTISDVASVALSTNAVSITYTGP